MSTFKMSTSKMSTFKMSTSKMSISEISTFIMYVAMSVTLHVHIVYIGRSQR
jgi:fluoride ion exporter CrcB/FEX